MTRELAPIISGSMDHGSALLSSVMIVPASLASDRDSDICQ